MHFNMHGSITELFFYGKNVQGQKKSRQ